MARRRRTNYAGTTLIAAATRVNLSKLPQQSSSTSTSGDDWRNEAWGYFDSVPEAGFACNFTGNSMAKLKLFAAWIPPGSPPDAVPIPVDAPPPPDAAPGSTISPQLAAFARREVESIRSLSGGQAEILRELNINLEVAAEAYIVVWAARPLPGDPAVDADGAAIPAEPEQWEVRSRDEIVVKDGVMLVRDDPGQPVDKMRKLNPDHDVAMRIWQRHPRWSGQTWCLMRSVLGELRLLQLLSGQLMAETGSRTNAGLIAIPNEMEIDKKPDIDPESGEPLPRKTFIDELADALIEPIGDPTAPSSIVPLVIKGPGDQIDKIRHITISRESSDIDSKITKRIERLARGLNLPVEVIMGHMNTTFANAEQIDEDTFEDYLEPRATLLTQAITYAHLQPMCREAFPNDSNVDRIVVWYDASALVSSPDTTVGADGAYDRGAISESAYRKAKGFNDDDAPDDMERLTRLAFRGFAAPPPEVMVAILDAVGIHINVAAATDDLAPSTADATPTTAPPTPEAVAAASQWLRENPVAARRLHTVAQARAIPAAHQLSRRKRSTPLGAQLVGIDRDLRARLIGLADSTMRQALDRAGNRLSNKVTSSEKRTLSRVQPAHRVAQLGASVLAAAHIDVDDLLADSFDGMRQQYMSWGATAQRDALDAVSQAVSGLTTAERELLTVRQAVDLTESWTWLEDTLTSLAKTRLFDPAIDVAVVGELDVASTVPPGALRAAMAKAGGATSLHIDDRGGVWLPMGNGGARPAGGIGTGELMLDTAAANGAARAGYRWVYGPAARTRPFEPHVELDGVEFENFDDDVLANNDSFPEFAYYIPGDHAGCICDFEPLLIM